MSRQRINFGEQEWAASPVGHWLTFAGNPNFPDYLRILFVAYGLRKANGHAPLRQGELTRFLVRKDGTLPDRRNVRHSIDQAIDYGYLMPESRMLCLVVPHNHMQGGPGQANRKCRRDHTVRASRQKDVHG